MTSDLVVHQDMHRRFLKDFQDSLHIDIDKYKFFKNSEVKN